LVQVCGRIFLADYPPGGHGHYDGSSSRLFGEGGSRPAGASCSDDEDDGGHDDNNDVE
jgi:hypothetical protein